MSYRKEPVIRSPFQPKYSPSMEQAAIFNELKFGDANIQVGAVAGSGKSTLLKWICVLTDIRNVGLMAFNSDIVKELLPHTPEYVDVKTCHAMGYNPLRKRFNSRVKDKGASKTRVILHDYSIFNPEGKSGKQLSEALSLRSEMENLVSKIKVTLTDWNDEEKIGDLICRYGIDLGIHESASLELLPAIMKKSVEQTGWIDFDDMMWLPIQYDLPLWKYDLLMVDEAQDLNKLMQEYASRISGGRVVIVGDECQCQPSGNKVMLSNGLEVDISEVKVGDELVGYTPGKGNIGRYNKVTQTQERNFAGNLFKVECGEFESTSTPNHKWYVKWSEESLDKYVLYLMEREGQFRIGTCQLFYKSKNSLNFGPGMRARQEKADHLWIIGYYDSNQKAHFHEEYYSWLFNIPQLMFQDPCTKGGFTDEEYLNGFWDKVGINSSDGLGCLDHFDLEYEYPFWSKYDNSHQGFESSFKIYACNLVSDLMMAPIIHPSHMNERTIQIWEKIKVTHTLFLGKVYSLDVDPSHTYVSNRILTCNSIYGFSGADTKSFGNLKERFNSEEYPLATCYRCGSDIIAEAQKINPVIQAHESTGTGEVRSFNASDNPYDYTDLPEGGLILSRRNASLVKPCFELIKKGRKAIIKGREIGVGLVQLIEMIGDCSVMEFESKLGDWQDEKIESIMKKKNPSQSSIDYVNDQAGALLAISEGCRDTSDMKNKINMIFQKDSKSGVVCSSIHKSKGLEAEHVAIIDYGRVRLSHEKMTEDEHQQEANLHYVALTRAKKKLDLVTY